MHKYPSQFSKIFGSGPTGLIISLMLLYGAYWLNNRFNLPAISQNQDTLNTVFFISVIVTGIIIVWSVISLPATDRGNKLCTSGVFKYVCHPLYAAFLPVFNFGLSFYLNSYVYILWAVLLHPVWHFVIRYEERMMINIFGDEYREYQKKTGRFVPKIIR